MDSQFLVLQVAQVSLQRFLSLFNNTESNWT